MKNYINYILIITLLLFASACSKDDDSIHPVDSKMNLNDTFWQMKIQHIVEYAEDGSVIGEETYSADTVLEGEEWPYIYIQHDDTIMFVAILWSSHYIHSYESYKYDATARTMKVGKTVYELLEFSNNRIEIRNSEISGSNKITVTRVFEPWSDNDKSWNEWVEYMNSENAKLQ